MELRIFREKKWNVGMLPVGLFREWSLPVWYYGQIDPKSPYFYGIPAFKNMTQRNWITLRPDGSVENYYLDHYGVLQIPGGASLELWIEEGEQYSTPLCYRIGNQLFRVDTGGVETEIHTEHMTVGFLCYPINGSDGVRWDIVVKQWDTRYNLRPISVLVVYRPFGNDGLAPTYRLEYRDGKLWADQRAILEVAKEPSVATFANETTGDLIPLLQRGSGNTGIESSRGWCAGVLGYRGLPQQIGPVSVTIHGRVSAKKRIFMVPQKTAAGVGQTGESVSVTTGTSWDAFLPIAEVHLNTFCPEKPDSVNISQIMTLNRYGKLQQSATYLEACLKRVRSNGELDSRYLGTDRILYAVEDYLSYGGDSRWLERYWNVMKRVAFYLKETVGQQGVGFSNCWHCASLRSFVELADLLRRPDNVSAFRNAYLELLQKFYRRAAMLSTSTEIPSQFTVEDCIALLDWSYPVHLSEGRWPERKGWLDLVKGKFCKQGGVVSPVEYSGVDLEYTAKLCQQAVWQGDEYLEFIRLFEQTAGTAWNWPDRVHPITWLGIGERGHDPAVLYQMMLLWRLLFIHEVGDELYLLPGIFSSRMWEHPNIIVEHMPTRFGIVSVSCQTVGVNTRIIFKPTYTRRPSRILLRLNPAYQVVYWDSPGVQTGNLLELKPEIQLIRLKKCTI